MLPRNILPRFISTASIHVPPSAYKNAGLNVGNFIPSFKVTGSTIDAPHAVDVQSHASLAMRAPKRIRELRVSQQLRAVAPEDWNKFWQQQVEESLGDPAQLITVYYLYCKRNPTIRRPSKNEVASPSREIEHFEFLSSVLQSLGRSFSPSAFWAISDRQVLTSKRIFKNLISDLIDAVDAPGNFSAPLISAAPGILFSLACLNYRPVRLIQAILPALEANVGNFSAPIIAHIAWSAASLNLSDDLLRRCLSEIGQRIASEGAIEPIDAGLLAWAISMAGFYEFGTPSFLPTLLSIASSNSSQHASSGWLQSWIYLTLYSADVEKPKNAIEISRSVPFEVQEKIHENWLDGLLLKFQPVGACRIQKSVDDILRRSNTQALVNCSVGRETDSQHCVFAGHLIKVVNRILRNGSLMITSSRTVTFAAIETNPFLPDSDGKPKVAGWLRWKTRLMKKMGLKVAVVHATNWEVLTEEQKEAQVYKLRTSLGYMHDSESEKRFRPIAWTPTDMV